MHIAEPNFPKPQFQPLSFHFLILTSFSLFFRHVQVNNEEAIAFYKQFGFEIRETKENYYKRLQPADALVLEVRLLQSLLCTPQKGYLTPPTATKTTLSIVYTSGFATRARIYMDGCSCLCACDPTYAEQSQNLD